MIIKEYLQYLLFEKGLSNKTIESYSLQLNKYNTYLCNKKIKIEEASYEDILSFLTSYKMSSTTYNHYITVFKNFYKYLIKQKVKLNFHINDLERKKREKHFPTVLKFNEIHSLITSFDNTLYAKRDKIIIMVLYSSGLRVSELINLKMSQINFNEGYIRCFGKGNKEKIIYCGDLLTVILAPYINNIRPEILMYRK